LHKSSFNLASLVVIVVLLGLLTAALLPAVSASHRVGNMSSVAARGRDIYIAITSANTDREPLGLPAVWPQSNPPTTNAVDISKMNFTNSTDYFWALYDGDHLGATNHNPYIKGFDFSKLAGAGVKVHTGQGRLKPENNMWTIAKNVRDEMEDIMPVLVSRNLAAESLVADLTTISDRRLFFDEEWKTPFGRKGL
jgi:type II secretory pathway pseudopilin PulG